MFSNGRKKKKKKMELLRLKTNYNNSLTDYNEHFFERR